MLEGAVLVHYVDSLFKLSRLFEGNGMLAPYVCTRFRHLKCMLEDATINRRFPEDVNSKIMYAMRCGKERAACEEKVVAILAPARKLITDFVGPERPETIKEKAMETAWSTFEACELVNVELIGAVTDNALEKLRIFPWVTPDTLIGLRSELPELQQFVQRFSGPMPTSKDLLSWWCARKGTFPHWSSLAFRVALVPVSNIPTERLFCIMRQLDSPQQHAAHDDTFELRILSAYNKELPHWC